MNKYLIPPLLSFSLSTPLHTLQVKPSSGSPSLLHPSHTHTWLVFAISLTDTQKIVNVRSSLVLHNTTELTMDVRLERSKNVTSTHTHTHSHTHTHTHSHSPSNGADLASSVNLPPLPPKGYAAVPLHLTRWDVRVRPQGWGTQYCGKSLVWRQAAGRSPTSHVRTCKRIGEGEESPFRFVQRISSLPPSVKKFRIVWGHM